MSELPEYEDLLEDRVREQDQRIAELEAERDRLIEALGNERAALYGAMRERDQLRAALLSSPKWDHELKNYWGWYRANVEPLKDGY
jgi:hypothetical protein